MNTKMTYIVLLIAIALAGYFIVFETDMFGLREQSRRQRERSGDTTPTPAAGQSIKPLAGLMAGDVQKLRIVRGEEPAVVIQRTDDSDHPWQQTEPVRFPAQKWTLDDLLGNATSLRYTTRITGDDLSPASAGLSPAKATLTLTGQRDDKAFTHTLKLGRTVAAGRAYVQVDDDPAIYVVDDKLHRQLIDKSPTELRSRSLATVAVGRVTTATLDHAGQTTVLAQDAGQWRITSPATGRADKDAAETLANAIGFASVSQFIEDKPESLKPFGLDEPTSLLTLSLLTTGNEKPLSYTLRIGSPADLEASKYFAMWQDVPVVFTVSKTTAEKLQKSAVDLRSRQLAGVAAGDVTAITIEQSGGGRLHFVREAGSWSFGEPKPAYGVDTGQVETLLDALTKTQSSGGAVAEAPRMAEPEAVVTLARADGKEPVVLHLKRADGQARVQVVGETLVNMSDAAVLAPVFADALYYRSRTVLDLSADDVVKVEIVRTGKMPAEYTFTRSAGEDGRPGTWNTQGHDAAAFSRLLRELLPLRATGWLPEGHGGGDSDAVTVTLTTSGGQTSRLLVVTGAEYGAHCSGVEMEFNIARSLGDLLMSELRIRTVLKLDADQITSITTHGQSVVRSPEGQYNLASGAPANEENAGALFDTISGLTAEHWLPTVPVAKTHPLVIRTTDGKSHTLRVWQDPAGQAMGRLDEGEAFTLSSDTYEKLTAEVVGAVTK